MSGPSMNMIQFPPMMQFPPYTPPRGQLPVPFQKTLVPGTYSMNHQSTTPSSATSNSTNCVSWPSTAISPLPAGYEDEEEYELFYRPHPPRMF